MNRAIFSELFETLLVVLSDPDPGSETRPITARHSAREAIRHSPAPPRLTGHVLLAEDNPVNQQVARGILEKLGLTLAVAPDGAAALKAIGDVDSDPDSDVSYKQKEKEKYHEIKHQGQASQRRPNEQDAASPTKT